MSKLKWFSNASGRLLALGLSVGVAVSMLVPATPAAAAEEKCDDDGKFCFEQVEGSRWFAGAKTNSKMRRKRSEKEPGKLSLTIDGGRGSVFLNGRYVGTAPLEDVEVPSGPNDLQVRDGSDVLAWGILTLPKGGTVVATVKHD